MDPLAMQPQPRQQRRRTSRFKHPTDALAHLATITSVAPIPNKGRKGNPNHHLWWNINTWMLVITVYPCAFTKERVRTSLRTKCVTTARQRRDVVLARLAAAGGRLTQFAASPNEGAAPGAFPQQATAGDAPAA